MHSKIVDFLWDLLFGIFIVFAGAFFFYMVAIVYKDVNEKDLTPVDNSSIMSTL